MIVVGYPHLFTDAGTTCNVNFLTSGNEKKLNETGDKLDAAIKARAEAHGFTFVDPRSAFKAHEVCASEEWLNGQSNPLEESYHPNVKGYAQLTTEKWKRSRCRSDGTEAEAPATPRRGSAHAGARASQAIQ